MTNAGHDQRADVRVAPLRPEDVPAVHEAYDRLTDDGKRFFHPGFLGSERRSARVLAGRLLLRLSARPVFLWLLQAIRVGPFLIAAIARDEWGVCGFAFVLVRRRIGARTGTYGIFVLPRGEGRGVGGQLTELVLRRARELALREVELTVQVTNDRARHLYERHGFVVVETVERGDIYKGKAYDFHRMILPLSGPHADHPDTISS